MRTFALLSILLLPVACSPAGPSPGRNLPSEPSLVAKPTAPPVVQTPEKTTKPTPPPSPLAPAPSSPRLIHRQDGSISFHGVAFDSRTHHMIVLDQPGGPGSKFADAETAGKSCGAFACANAGFFTPEGDPLGLVISEGKTSGGWNTASSLGSAVWHASTGGGQAISRRSALPVARTKGMENMLQAGPMLIENKTAVSGLSDRKTSARTFILWDGGTRWWLGVSSPCTLHDLAQTLQRSSPSGWTVRTAMNLDGGRSSDLWVSPNTKGGPYVQRTLWNRPVRNFLAVVAK